LIKGETQLEIRWLDMDSGEIYDGEELVALIEFEDNMFTGSVLDGDDLWFTSECDTEEEVLEQVQEYLENLE